MARFVESEKRKNKVVDEQNYIYTYSKSTVDNENDIWVCERRGLCKGRVWTVAGDTTIVKVVSGHNHASTAARPMMLDVVQGIRNRARTTQEQPQQIMAISVENVHRNVAVLLPKKANLKRTIRNQRVNNVAPPLPRSVEELLLPQEYQEIKIDDNLQQFLQYDSGVALLPGRMLIFSTHQNLLLLSQCNEWFGDGTFSTASHLFQQLYTIHVNHLGTVIPVVYALLPNKTRATYVKLLQELKNLQPGLQPQFLMTDFELAAMQAFETEFPGIQKTGCFFHLCQNVWKHVQGAQGLQEMYQNSHEFAQFVRMIPALAFVPTVDVERAFEALTADANFPHEAQPIANYFEDTYIGRPNRRGNRQPAVYPIALWNVNARTLNNQQRTNNDIEGWHRGFQATCGTFFPNIYRFIDGLKRRQALHNYEIVQLIAGNPVNQRNKKYAVIASRILTIVQDYANRDIISFLRGIAYNYEL